MMKSWISGAAKKAILRHDNSYYLLTNDSSGKPKSITGDEAAALLEDWDDAYMPSVKSIEEVREELRRAVRGYDALLVASLALDAGVSNDRRCEAAIEANRLLQEEFALRHVLNAYCAYPMPTRASLDSALQICESKELSKLSEVIKTVQSYEGKIRDVREAWDSIKTGEFGGTEERAIFQSEAVRSGLFQSMVKRIGDLDRREMFLKVIDKTSIPNLPNYEKVLKDWLKGLPDYQAPPVASVSLFKITSGATRIEDLTTMGTWPGMIHAGVRESVPAFA